MVTVIAVLYIEIILVTIQLANKCSLTLFLQCFITFIVKYSVSSYLCNGAYGVTQTK